MTKAKNINSLRTAISREENGIVKTRGRTLLFLDDYHHEAR